MSLTLKQIFTSLARVPSGSDGEDRFDRATRVRIMGFKRGVSKSTGAVTFLTKTRTTDVVKGKLSHENHVTSLNFLAGSRKYVKLSCSCADFWSKWEYNLAKKGAADIIYGNGDPPTTKIPLGACIAEGSHVLLASGRLKPIEEVVVGDLLATPEGPAKCSAAENTQAAARVLRLSHANGSLTATPDHAVLAVKKGDVYVNWIEAGDLAPGDFLVQYVPTLKSKVSLTTKASVKAEAVGFFVAEFHETHGASIEGAEVDYANTLFQALFGSTTNYVEGYRLKFSKEELSTLLTFVEGRYQQVPSWVLTADLSTRVAFLRGAWSGDGWFSSKLHASTLATSSTELLEGYEKLLTSLGVPFSTTENLLRVGTPGEWMQYLIRPSTEGSHILWTLFGGLPKYPTHPSSRKNKPKVQPINPFCRTAISEETAKAAAARFEDTLRWAKGPWVPFKWGRGNIKNSGGLALLITRFPKAFRTGSVIEVRHSALLAAQQLARGPGVYKASIEEAGPQRFVQELQRAGASTAAVAYYTEWLLRENIRYLPIQGVEICDARVPVYDLTVPGPECFVANSIVVHNCKHVIRLVDYAVNEGLLNSNFELNT